MPQRVSPDAAAASSVKTAWWVRWKAPMPKCTIPMESVAGSTSGPVTPGRLRTSAVRVSADRRGMVATRLVMGCSDRWSGCGLTPRGWWVDGGWRRCGSDGGGDGCGRRHRGGLPHDEIDAELLHGGHSRLVSVD